MSSRYLSSGDGGHPQFPLTTVNYSVTSRQTLSGFKDFDDTSTNILNESGQSVPLAFDDDIHHSGSYDLPEHLYGTLLWICVDLYNYAGLL